VTVAPPAAPPQPNARPAQTEGLAIGALIAGIVFWPVGVVLSILALSKVKKTGNGGRGLAIAGLILSIVGFIVTIATILAVVLVLPSLTTVDRNETGGIAGTGAIQDSVALGETGTTGNGVEFTATAVECGIPTVDNEYDPVDADGQFCKVSLTVANKGTVPFSYAPSFAAAFVGDAEYGFDSEATVRDTDAVLDEFVNPDASIDTVVYFDLPSDAIITRLVFTEDYAGGAVEVTL